MNQIKVGRFISECRKKENLTQAQLAEKLGITDKAVSKWETGKAMPDSSVMLELCGVLKITVNDLLSGEVVAMDNYNKELESKLLEMTKQKEVADKRSLTIVTVLGTVCVISLVAAIVLALTMPLEAWQKTIMIIIGILPMFIATPFMLKIRLLAGYYLCVKCGHRYVPEYRGVSMSVHI